MGPCYVSNELKTYLKDQLKMKQVYGKTNASANALAFNETIHKIYTMN